MKSAMEQTRIRMAVVVSHPILFQSVLLRRLAQQPELEVVAFFHSDLGSDAYFDKAFGRAIAWDVPVLGGYEHRFLRRIAGRETGLGGAMALAWQFVRGDFDVVILNGWLRVADWWFALVATLARVPILMRSDSNASQQTKGLRGFAKRLLLGALFRATAGFLVAGKKNGDFYARYGGDRRRFYSVPFGVDNDRFSVPVEDARALRRVTRESLGIAEDAVVFLFVGKLVSHKRPSDLLGAIKRMAQDSRAVALFAGDGNLREELEAQARSLPRGSAVLPGFVNQSELPAIYAASDVFVLPSQREPWGLVVNEAACAGLPLLLSDQVGAAADFVEEGTTGHIFRVGDVDALAQHMAELCRDPDRRRAMGEIARQRGADHGPAKAVAGVLAAVRAAVCSPGRRA